MKKLSLVFLLLLQFVILPQNSFIKQITNGDFDARNPFISPKYFTNDFEKIFFEMHKNGYANIYSIKYNPITQTFEDTVAITNNVFSNTNPLFQAYSGLVFQTNQNGNWDIMFAPDSMNNLGSIRFLANTPEDETSPKFIKSFVGEIIYDTTRILFKRSNALVLLSLKEDHIIEEIIFQNTSGHSYIEFEGLYHDGNWGTPEQGYYIFAIEEDSTHQRKLVYRYRPLNGSWGTTQVIIDSCKCSNLGLQSVDYFSMLSPIFQISQNENKRFYFLNNWVIPETPIEIPIQWSGNVVRYKSYVPPMVTKDFNSKIVRDEIYYPNTYIIERQASTNIRLNINENGWWQLDTLYKCLYPGSNITIGPLGFENGEMIVYTVWEDSINGQIHLFGRKEFIDLSSVEDESYANDFVLYQNYPNPFNPSTKIEYKLLNASDVMFNVVNILGEKVFEQNFGYQTAGSYKVNFDGKNLPAGRQGLPSGVYVYSIYTNENRLSRKMLLMK